MAECGRHRVTASINARNAIDARASVSRSSSNRDMRDAQINYRRKEK